MSDAVAALRERLATIADLQGAAGILGWDQRTMMPPTGVEARSEQLAALARVTHHLAASDETGRLLDQAERAGRSLGPDSDDACLLRVARRDFDKARRVPPELRAEMIRAGSLATPVWSEARRRSDWSLFEPHLARALELRRRYIACFEAADEDYDVLLDDFEPGRKTAEVRAVFAELREGLRPLIAGVAERADAVDDSCLHGGFPVERQRALEREILGAFGFSDRSWRLDETTHPFQSKSGPDDIRITTRRREDTIRSIFSCMHEFGHGLYEHGVDRALARSPLGHGASLSIHESQSRLWENLVGRSRPFWKRFFPIARDLFPEALGGVDAEGFYRAVNRAGPSLIRVEADEATYNMHVILRFELEQDMIAGEIAPADVPDAWRAKMREYLGIEVPDVARGALQDIHWAAGHIGYFSTYALGNVAAAQIWERVRADVADLDARIEAGDFAPLREWLRDRVHRHGRKFTPQELLRRVAGSDLDPKPLLRYLGAKLGEIYALSSPGQPVA